MIAPEHLAKAMQMVGAWRRLDAMQLDLQAREGDDVPVSFRRSTSGPDDAQFPVGRQDLIAMIRQRMRAITSDLRIMGVSAYMEPSDPAKPESEPEEEEAAGPDDEIIEAPPAGGSSEKVALR